MTSNERSTDPAFLTDCLRRCCAPPGWTLVELCQWAAGRLTGETSEEPDPCVSHLALKEWDRMFDAWVKHQAGLPSDVPLWPNPEWSQDVAMIAHALAGSSVKTSAGETGGDSIWIEVREGMTLGEIGRLIDAADEKKRAVKTSAGDAAGDECPQCGNAITWVPKAGDLLTEIETEEPCHIEWIQYASARVKWDARETFYGIYNLRDLRQKFARRAPGETPAELASDFARAATLENDGHGYTVWRIGGRQFVPLDEAQAALASHELPAASSPETAAPIARSKSQLRRFGYMGAKQFTCAFCGSARDIAEALQVNASETDDSCWPSAPIDFAERQPVPGEYVLLYFEELPYPVVGDHQAWSYKQGGFKAKRWLPLPKQRSEPT